MADEYFILVHRGRCWCGYQGGPGEYRAKPRLAWGKPDKAIRFARREDAALAMPVLRTLQFRASVRRVAPQ